MFLFVVVFSGCKKSVTNGRPEFIGYWCTTGSGESGNIKIILDIKENDDADYIEIAESSYHGEKHGKARANSDKLKIGSVYHFKILEYPHIIDTTVEHVHISPNYSGDQYSPLAPNWKMKLSSLIPKVYMKGPFTFYKVEY